MNNAGIHLKVTAVKIILTILFILIGFTFVFPFITTFTTSLKTSFELMKFPTKFLPINATLNNYVTVLSSRYNYPLLYFNSIKITFINVAGCVVTSTLSGYAFGRLKFKGRDAIFLLYLATLMIPPQVTLIPRFIQFTWMGITNTHWSLILPGIFSVIGVFLMRQSFMQIPYELSESAYIDGAGEYRTFFQIIIPTVKPALVTIVITTFNWQWNDYENPLIFLRDKSLFTLPLGLTAFSDENGAKFELICAAAMLACLPLILIFLFIQKQFINGLIVGALKE